MPKEVQQQHMPLAFPRIFWSLADLNSRMNWPRKPHEMCTNICNMCTLLPTLRGDLHLLPEDILSRVEQEARVSTEVYPPGYDMKVAVQEFHKLHKPKINKLKGGYSATANLIFQSWLKDIHIHVQNWNLTEREAIQLVKDFTTERAHDEVEFYMGMIADEQQSFDGLVNHLKHAFQLGETMSELISDFYGCHQKKNESEDAFADDLQILVRKIIA